MSDTPVELKEIDFYDEEIETTEEAAQEDLQKIVSYNVANTIEVLKLKIENNEINLKPEFQRDFVWDINRASLFIDSLIIGLPIPSIFLGKSKVDENFMVIDGQQRLKSAYYFMTGNFMVNNIPTIFTLKGLKKREWNGKSYDELEEKHKRRIRNAVINTTIIEDIDTKPKVVHDLFHRLNTGGMPLTDQEIRNCVYSGSLNKLLMSLNHNKNWRKLLNAEIPDKRLRDVELILRFFALYQSSNTYQPSMKLFLSGFQEKYKDDDNKVLFYKEVFESTVKIILENIGPDAFKTTRSINKSIFDSIMVSVAQITVSGVSIDNIRMNYERLIKDEQYIRYTQSGVTSETNVKGRIDLARNYFLGLR